MRAQSPELYTACCLGYDHCSAEPSRLPSPRHYICFLNVFFFFLFLRVLRKNMASPERNPVCFKVCGGGLTTFSILLTGPSPRFQVLPALCNAQLPWVSASYEAARLHYCPFFLCGGHHSSFSTSGWHLRESSEKGINSKGRLRACSDCKRRLFCRGPARVCSTSLAGDQPAPDLAT